MKGSLTSALLAWLIPFSGVMLNELQNMPKDASLSDVSSVTLAIAVIFGVVAAAKDWKALSTLPPKKRNEL